VFYGKKVHRNILNENFVHQAFSNIFKYTKTTGSGKLLSKDKVK
jgi:hypothetical protein